MVYASYKHGHYWYEALHMVRFKRGKSWPKIVQVLKKQEVNTEKAYF